MAAAVVVLSIAAFVGVLVFFNSRDDATIGEDQVAPGKADPNLTDARLRRGNVILRYSRAADRAALEEIAEQIAGEPDPSLIEAGQAIIVERRSGGRILANAFKRSLAVDSAGDPALREFAEYWLGRTAMR
jgi:hypothetical protein